MNNEQNAGSGIAPFITFEGPEGSGKSTQIQLLTKYLKEMGKEVVVTREPGGTPIGDKIRSLMLSSEFGKIEAETELFLMLAQRFEHFVKVIRPAINSGKIVLCDRYYDSSVVYQGYARELGFEKVQKVHDLFMQNYLPDLTFLIQIPPKTGLQRATHGGKKQHDRIESESLDFHKRVFDGYNHWLSLNSERFVCISSEGSPESIFAVVVKSLVEKLTYFDQELKK